MKKGKSWDKKIAKKFRKVIASKESNSTISPIQHMQDVVRLILIMFFVEQDRKHQREELLKRFNIDEIEEEMRRRWRSDKRLSETIYIHYTMSIG